MLEMRPLRTFTQSVQGAKEMALLLLVRVERCGRDYMPTMQRGVEKKSIPQIKYAPSIQNN